MSKDSMMVVPSLDKIAGLFCLKYRIRVPAAGRMRSVHVIIKHIGRQGQIYSRTEPEQIF